MNKCLSIDWLQIYSIVPAILESKSGKVTIELANYQTRHFKKIFFVRSTQFFDGDKGEEIATIACVPAENSVIEQGTGLVKISNKYLYQADLMEFVQDLFHDLRMQFISFSRIDICMDFINFQNDMNPEDFIKGFVFGKYIKKGRKTTFKLQGETRTGLTAKAIKQKNFVEHQYLGFGKETSDVSYKLYNKSREMTAKTMKQWIMLHWQDNGYLNNDFVWRLEFSLKNDQKQNIVKEEDGEVFDFSIFKNIETLEPETIEVLFSYYLNRCFAFYKNEGKARKDRNTTLQLFDNKAPGFCRLKISDSKDTGRTHKIFAKHLMELNQELRGDDYVLGMFAQDLAIHYLHRYNLQNWAKDKGFTTEHTHSDWENYTKGVKEKQQQTNQLELLLGFDEFYKKFLEKNK